MKSYEKHNEIIAAIRWAYKGFKHHKELTKRCRTFLEEALPGYTIYFSSEPAGHGVFAYRKYEIDVWGNGISMDEKVCIHWSESRNSVIRTWQEGFEEAIEINDFRDYAEREEMEKMLVPELGALEAQVRTLQAKAEKMVASLPVPTSSTVRKESSQWENASLSLRKQFPFLFN